MADLPTEVVDTSDTSVVAGKRKAEDPLPSEPIKRAAASSSTNPKDSEDDSEQEDDDLDEDLDFLETSNIIHSGRRTRGVKIDFTQVPQDDLEDEDEDDLPIPPEVVYEDEDDEDEDEDEEEEENDNDNEAEPKEAGSSTSN